MWMLDGNGDFPVLNFLFWPQTVKVNWFRIPISSERYFRRYMMVVSVSAGSGVGSP
jgi:hypothetical protein